MELYRCSNASEDTFPLPRAIKERYGPFGFPEPADPRRPHITSNFVMGLDGRASFRELKGCTGGKTVSRSREDRWLMDFLRAHHEAQLIGANTLREESDDDYGIDDEPLRIYRQETLGLGLQKVLVLTGSGNIDVTCRLFRSPRVEPWIITAPEGEKNLRSQFKRLGREEQLRLSVWVEARGSISPPRRKCFGKNMASGRYCAKAGQRCMESSSRIISWMRTFERFRCRFWVTRPRRGLTGRRRTVA